MKTSKDFLLIFLSIFFALQIVSMFRNKEEEKQKSDNFVRFIEADILLHQDNIERIYYLDINGIKDTFRINGDFKEVRIVKK